MQRAEQFASYLVPILLSGSEPLYRCHALSVIAQAAEETARVGRLQICIEDFTVSSCIRSILGAAWTHDYGASSKR
jgi:hypothetical protein